MRLNCELEVVYSLAMENGRGRSTSKSNRSKASVCLGKKPSSNQPRSPEGNEKREELFLVVSTAKNVSGSKYKVGGGHYYGCAMCCTCRLWDISDYLDYGLSLTMGLIDTLNFILFLTR